MSKSSSENKKSKKSVAPAPVVEAPPAVEVAPVVIAPTPQEEVSVSSPVVEEVVLEFASEQLLQRLEAEIKESANALKTAQLTFKLLQKELAKEHKEKRKQELKLQKKKNNKKATGGAVAKTCRISSELQQFLGLESGAEIARSEAEKRIYAYVRENKLQNPEDKRIVVPDQKLADLLQNGNSEVQIFGIRTFLKKHFLPPLEVASASVGVSA